MVYFNLFNSKNNLIRHNVYSLCLSTFRLNSSFHFFFCFKLIDTECVCVCVFYYLPCELTFGFEKMSLIQFSCANNNIKKPPIWYRWVAAMQCVCVCECTRQLVLFSSLLCILLIFFVSFTFADFTPVIENNYPIHYCNPFHACSLDWFKWIQLLYLALNKHG